MNQSSLDALIELATSQRDEAAAALGSLQSQKARSQSQLDALIAYRREYGQRLSAAIAQGLPMHRLQNDQRFLASLDDAIAQQRHVVANSETRLADGKQHWQSRQHRLKSYETLDERSKAEAERRHMRREQQENDEFAGRLALGR